MPGKHNKPYKMYPGMHSEVNPGNFKGSEVMKYKAMKMHPMKMVDLSGDGKITKKDVLIGAGVKGFEKGMDKPNMYGKPMNYKKGYPGMEPKMHHAKKYKK